MLKIFSHFKSGLSRTSQAIHERLTAIFSKKFHSKDDWERLEACLYQADFGSSTVQQLMQALHTSHSPDQPPEEILRQALNAVLAGSEGFSDQDSSQLPISHLSDQEAALSDPSPTLQVVLLLGINGAGKTTTAAKIAHCWQQQKLRVLLGSCDTFRAAANQQLKAWADRLQLDCIESQQGADAASVAYDVCQAGMHRGYDRIILDTAGRLHNKTPLLEEIKKMVRVLQKCNPYFPQHRWLVIDGSLGTNSLQQAQMFNEAVPLTGLVVTKLDGSGKGGALVSIFDTLKIPIYFVGMGEQAEDLQPFSKAAYVDGLIAPRV